MIILKGAFAITLHRVIETILSIILFRTIFHWVKVITGLWGLYSFFIAIFINIKTRTFIINKYIFYKKKFFPKYADKFEFDSKLLVGHDLKKIISSNVPITNTKGVSLTVEEVQSIRADFIQLKSEMGNHLFEFIFKSATQSALINLFTMMLSENLKTNYGISIIASLTICISLSFVISFVSSLNYAKMLLKEWEELIDNIEKTNNNRRLILYVYGNPKPLHETKVEESTKMVEQPTVVHQRKGDKKSKSKQENAQKQEKPVEKVLKKTNPDQFIVGIVSSEIENQEHLKIKLMLLNPKFTQNASDISENFVTKFIPHVLLTTPATNLQSGGGIKNMIGTIGGLMQNFYLMSQLNTIATDDPFFSTNTLKECTVYVTDYYDVASKLSNYLKTKGFKLQEKWAEYNIFLFIKFKVYEYRKNFSNLGNRNQQTAAPQINLGNLFGSLNATQAQNNSATTNAQPKINLNNLFSTPNTATQNTQPPINIFESLRALNAQKNNAQSSINDSNTTENTSTTPRPAINLLDSLKSLNLQNNSTSGLLQQLLNNLAQQNAQKVQNDNEKPKTS
jgi:hypothetical protein